MTLDELLRETDVVSHDTEFREEEPTGEHPFPWCEAWMSLRDRARRTQWIEGVSPSELASPYRPGDLVIAYNISAEAGVNRRLGRPQPTHAIDLFAEFALFSNGLGVSRRLIDAMSYYGLEAMESSQKKLWHDRFRFTAPPFPSEWKPGALDYNFEDVGMAARLFERMLPEIDVAMALRRGQYMIALAEIRYEGFPVDVPLYKWIQEHWDEAKERMIEACPYDVFDGLSFSQQKFGTVLRDELGVTSWETTPAGRLRTDSKYFERMAFEYPELSQVHRVMRTISTFDKFELAIGPDGRNRASWWPFGSITGRNQPKRLNIFSNHSRWVRGLGTPPDGRALVQLDYEQQEFGIVAAMSNDQAMIESYRTGDAYMQLAIRSGDAPPHATKETHKPIRDKYKVTALSVQFGSTGEGIARRLHVPPAEGCLLLRKYNAVFEAFREWQKQKRLNVRYGEPMVLPLGWRALGGTEMGWRTIDNFWAQGTGSEMLRAVVVKLRQAGFAIVALIHDAVIIEVEDRDVKAASADASRIMGDVSEQILLGRLRLGTEETIVRPGQRLLCPEAREMWSLVTGPHRAGNP